MQTTQNVVYLNLTSGPPVARMECILYNNRSISNSTLIYRGGDKMTLFVYDNYVLFIEEMSTSGFHFTLFTYARSKT